MTSIAYDANHTNETELKLYLELINAILAKVLREPQVKRLQNFNYHGYPVYRAKINKKDRLFYAMLPEDQVCFLGTSPHNYEKMKRALSSTPGNVANTTKHKLSFFDTASTEATSNEQPLALPAIKAPVAHLEFCPAIPYKREEILVLDSDQQAVLKKSLPLEIHGPAGSGKSGVLWAIVRRALTKSKEYDAESQATEAALFISASADLMEEMQQIAENAKMELRQLPKFLTWEQLLQSHYQDRWVVDEARFEVWLMAHTKNPLLSDSRAVHYELSLIMALGIEKYATLGKRQSHYSGNSEVQQELVDLLASWQRYLEEPMAEEPMAEEQIAAEQSVQKKIRLKRRQFDPMITRLPETAQRYGYVYCDEAQNLPPIALACLLNIVKGKHFVACLDTEQAILSSPYIHNCLHELMYLRWQDGYEKHALAKTWRCLPGVINVANQVMNAKYDLDGKDKRRPYKNVSSMHAAGGLVSWVDEKNLEFIKSAYGGSAKTVVITENSSAADRMLIKEKLGTANILSPERAIGLDFETVVLWNPFSAKTDCFQPLYNKRSNEQLDLKQLNAFNALYVSLTRAQKRVYIYDHQQKRWSGLGKQILGELLLAHAETQSPVTESDVEKNKQEWLELVELYFKRGKSEDIRAARDIMNFNLNLSDSEIEEKIKAAQERRAAKISKQKQRVLSNALEFESASAVAQVPIVEPHIEVSASEVEAKTKQVTTPAKSTQVALVSPLRLEPPQNKKEFETFVDVCISSLIEIDQNLSKTYAIKSPLIKNIKNPNAETYLFNTSLKNIPHLKLQKDMSLFEYLKTNVILDVNMGLVKFQILAASVLIELSKAKKKTSSDLVNLLCRAEYHDMGYSLLSMALMAIPDFDNSLWIERKATLDQIIHFIKANIKSEKLNDCLSKILFTNKKNEFYLAHVAAMTNSIRLLNLLYKLGINLNISAENGCTPIDIAMQCGSGEAAHFLQKLGFQVEQRIQVRIEQFNFFARQVIADIIRTTDSQEPPAVLQELLEHNNAELYLFRFSLKAIFSSVTGYLSLFAYLSEKLNAKQILGKAAKTYLTTLKQEANGIPAAKIKLLCCPEQGSLGVSLLFLSLIEIAKEPKEKVVEFIHFLKGSIDPSQLESFLETPLGSDGIFPAPYALATNNHSLFVLLSELAPEAEKNENVDSLTLRCR